MRHPRASIPGVLLLVLLAAPAGLAQTTSAPASKSDEPNPTPAPAPAPAPKPEAKPAPKPLDQPKMLTAEETARRARGPSMFLDAAKSDRYGEAAWADAPPWRRANFYGVRSVAQTVVFVVDCSGSMGQGDRLERAKRELRRSVADMQFPQQFLVIFYNDEPIPMPGAALKSAEAASREQLLNWLRTIGPDGGTDPRSALRMAIRLKPDAIYLLSDGAFPEGTAENVAARNDRKVPIHCIDLTGGAAGDHLQRIARDSGGQYAARP